MPPEQAKFHPARLWAALLALLLSSCRSLPDAQFLSRRYATESASFEGAFGPLSARRSAALLARLKHASGGLDSIAREVALEQEIVGRPLVVGNRVLLLQDPPAAEAAIFAAAARAKASIDAEIYSIQDDEVGRRFARILLERSARGVAVNLVYDSVGALQTPKRFFDRLRAGGVRVIEYNTVNPLKVRKPWKLGHRDHRKLIVIDGGIVFVGGINLESPYSSGHSFELRRSAPSRRGENAWRDTDVEIEGPAAAEFQKVFLETWAKESGPPLSGPAYFPQVREEGRQIVRAVPSSPDEPYSRSYLALLAAITNAERRVYIANAYFVPDPQLRRILCQAARRGVDVRLLLPGHTDFKAAAYAGRSYYAELLEAGVKIYERRGALLHAKTAVIDGIWSCVGSSNLDWRSALDNEEISAVIIGADFGRQMLESYARDFASSDEVNLQAWKHRSLSERLKETTARLLGRLL